LILFTFRHFNELAAQGAPLRDRAISSPIPYPSQPHRPKSPAGVSQLTLSD